MALTSTSEQTWRFDLYKVSQIENVTPNLSLGRGGPTASSWRRAQWFNIAVLFFTTTFTVSNVVSDSGLLPLAAFYLLTASTLISFWVLSAAPFINPIQSFVLVQYVWFGVAPAVLSGYALLRGQLVDLAVLQDDVILISIVVAPGLVLYSVASRLTIRQLRSWISVPARRLLAPASGYEPKFLLLLCLVVGIAHLCPLLLGTIGIVGVREVNYLGGTQTDIWWIGLIVAVGSIQPLVVSSLVSAWAFNGRRTPLLTKVLLITFVLLTLWSSLIGGWKSPLLILCSYYALAFISRFQRFPWALVLIATVGLVGFIGPFINQARFVATQSEIKDSTERQKMFLEVFLNPSEFLSTSLDSVDSFIALPFRGIMPLAAEVTRRNGAWSGEWGGSTFAWGLEALVPRVFHPAKPEMNIGNYLFRALRVGNDENTFHSVAISLPFEVVGNFGIVAGVLSFGAIGVVWAAICVGILTANRLATHPLSPYMSIGVVAMEGAFGHYLAGLRELAIGLAVMAIVSVLSGRNRVSRIGRDAARITPETRLIGEI